MEESPSDVEMQTTEEIGLGREEQMETDEAASVGGSEVSNTSVLSWAERQLRRRARTAEDLRRPIDLEAQATADRP